MDILMQVQQDVVSFNTEKGTYSGINTGKRHQGIDTTKHSNVTCCIDLLTSKDIILLNQRYR